MASLEFSESRARLNDLKAERRRILASIVTKDGEADDAVLEALDERIAETEKVAGEDEKAEANQSDTLAGLNERRDILKAKIKHASDELSRLQNDYLRGKLQDAAKAYSKAETDLLKAYGNFAALNAAADSRGVSVLFSPRFARIPHSSELIEAREKANNRLKSVL